MRPTRKQIGYATGLARDLGFEGPDEALKAKYRMRRAPNGGWTRADYIDLINWLREGAPTSGKKTRPRRRNPMASKRDIDRFMARLRQAIVAIDEPRLLAFFDRNTDRIRPLAAARIDAVRAERAPGAPAPPPEPVREASSYGMRLGPIETRKTSIRDRDYLGVYVARGARNPNRLVFRGKAPKGYKVAIPPGRPVSDFAAICRISLMAVVPYLNAIQSLATAATDLAYSESQAYLARQYGKDAVGRTNPVMQVLIDGWLASNGRIPYLEEMREKGTPPSPWADSDIWDALPESLQLILEDTRVRGPDEFRKAGEFVAAGEPLADDELAETWLQDADGQRMQAALVAEARKQWDCLRGERRNAGEPLLPEFRSFGYWHPRLGAGMFQGSLNWPSYVRSGKMVDIELPVNWTEPYQYSISVPDIIPPNVQGWEMALVKDEFDNALKDKEMSVRIPKALTPAANAIIAEIKDWLAEIRRNAEREEREAAERQKAAAERKASERQRVGAREAAAAARADTRAPVRPERDDVFTRALAQRFYQVGDDARPFEMRQLAPGDPARLYLLRNLQETMQNSKDPIEKETARDLRNRIENAQWDRTKIPAQIMPFAWDLLSSTVVVDLENVDITAEADRPTETVIDIIKRMGVWMKNDSKRSREVIDDVLDELEALTAPTRFAPGHTPERPMPLSILEPFWSDYAFAPEGGPAVVLNANLDADVLPGGRWRDLVFAIKGPIFAALPFNAEPRMMSKNQLQLGSKPTPKQRNKVPMPILRNWEIWDEQKDKTADQADFAAWDDEELYPQTGIQASLGGSHREVAVADLAELLKQIRPYRRRILATVTEGFTTPARVFFGPTGAFWWGEIGGKNARSEVGKVPFRQSNGITSTNVALNIDFTATVLTAVVKAAKRARQKFVTVQYRGRSLQDPVLFITSNLITGIAQVAGGTAEAAREYTVERYLNGPRGPVQEGGK